MENNNHIQPISDRFSKEVKDQLVTEANSLLIDFPYKRAKHLLWEFYRAWVCNIAQVADSHEHEDTMLFYERLNEFLKVSQKLLKHGK